MPRYDVTVEFTARRNYEVEAGSPEEAEDEALSVADVADLKYTDFCVDVVDVEEI